MKFKIRQQELIYFKNVQLLARPMSSFEMLHFFIELYQKGTFLAYFAFYGVHLITFELVPNKTRHRSLQKDLKESEKRFMKQLIFIIEFYFFIN